MSYARGGGWECDGCKRHIALEDPTPTLYYPSDAKFPNHYCDPCWQTGWYTGIEPKGEWPIPAVAEDPWPDEVGHGAGDPVNHPPHYRWLPNGIEVIDITESFGFLLGNVLKYVMRADHKGKPIEDLEKAAWYLSREIANRKAKRDNGNTEQVV